MQESRMPVRCDLCDDEDAVFHCDDCSYNFCSLCSTAVHEDAGRQQHEPRRLDEVVPPRAPDLHAPPLAIPTPDLETLPGGSGPSPGSGPTTPGEGGRVWVSLPDAAAPVSPTLAHRIGNSKGTNCAQCASLDSYVGGVCQLCGFVLGCEGGAPTRADDQQELIPRCPTAGHPMVMSMGNYTCNICRRHFDSSTLKNLPTGRSSRWSCAACGDDFCLDCRPEREANESLRLDHNYSPQQVDVDQYGLARALHANACQDDDPRTSKHSETRSATPELMREDSASATPLLHALDPPERCGLGFRLCHSSLGKLSVDKILSGGAAEHQGSLKRGDQILSINGKSTADLVDAEDVARALVGDVGSTASLRVQRAQDGEHPFEVELERRLFEGQFDSIHSGLPPGEVDANMEPQERPHSMPSPGNILRDEAGTRDPTPRAPLSAPTQSIPTSSMSTETPSLLLQERLERAIQRMTPQGTPAKSPAPWRSETPIEVLLAKYATSSSPGALPLSIPHDTSSPSTPPPMMSDLPPAEDSPTPIKHPSKPEAPDNIAGETSEDPSVPVVCHRCHRLYLPSEILSSRPGLHKLNCCVDCIDQAHFPIGEDKDSLSILCSQSAAAAAALDRRSWGLAQILGRAPEKEVSEGSEEMSGTGVAEDGQIQSSGDKIDLQDRASSLNLEVSGQLHHVNEETEPTVAKNSRSNSSSELQLATETRMEHGVAALRFASQEVGTGLADSDESGMTLNPAQPLTAPSVFSSAMPSEDHLTTTGNNPTAPSSEVVMPTDTGPVGPHDSERVLRKGWLTKDSGLKSLFMKSQKRWCVLKTGYFQYFHSESEDGRSEVISLSSMEAVSVETRRSTAFLVIKTPQRSFTFTSNDKSANATVFEWLQDITRVLNDSTAARRTVSNVPSGAQRLSSPYSYGAPVAIQAHPFVVPPAKGTVYQPQLAPRPAPMSYSRPLPGNTQPRPWPLGGLGGQENADSWAHMEPIPTLPRPDAHQMPAGMGYNWASNGEGHVDAAMHAGAVTQVGNGENYFHPERLPTPDHLPYGMHGPEAYDLYSTMYENDALATRTGVLISADVSPSMAAMSDPPRPTPMHH